MLNMYTNTSDNIPLVSNDDFDFQILTNVEHLGNIWGYASESRDRLTGKLPVTKNVEEQKESL